MISDIILGGLTGLIGNAFTTWFKYKNAKMEFDHEERMVNLKTQAMIQTAQMEIDITKTKIAGKIDIEDSKAFTTSQTIGSKTLFHEKWIDMIMEGGNRKWTGWFFRLLGTLIAAGFAFVDWLNSFMRPALTIYLVGGSSYITYLAWMIMEQAGIGTMDIGQAIGIFTQVTSTMIYLAVSAVTWWFGDRTMSKYLQQQGARKNNIITNPPTTPPAGGKGGKGGGGDVDI